MLKKVLTKPKTHKTATHACQHCTYVCAIYANIKEKCHKAHKLNIYRYKNLGPQHMQRKIFKRLLVMTENHTLNQNHPPKKSRGDVGKGDLQILAG